jgi:hypothetical protein
MLFFTINRYVYYVHLVTYFKNSTSLNPLIQLQYFQHLMTNKYIVLYSQFLIAAFDLG